MIIAFEVVFSSIAVILSLLSFKTFRAISRLGVGKSFWIPVFVSSVLFFVGSLLTIFYEIGFSLGIQTLEVVYISRIFALMWLVFGIYSYSRRVRASLREEFSIPEQLVNERLKLDVSNKESLEMEPPVREKVLFSETRKNSKKELTPICKHQLGFLQTLPKNAPIPDECLSCDRIIECKHSLSKRLKTHLARPKS